MGMAAASCSSHRLARLLASIKMEVEQAEDKGEAEEVQAVEWAWWQLESTEPRARTIT